MEDDFGLISDEEEDDGDTDVRKSRTTSYSTVAEPSKADVLYCGVCKKKFKSQSQWRNHEQSKRHITLTAKLREELRVSGDSEDGEKEREEHGETSSEEDESEESLSEENNEEGDESEPLHSEEEEDEDKVEEEVMDFWSQEERKSRSKRGKGQPANNKEQGVDFNGKEEEWDTDRGSRSRESKGSKGDLETLHSLVQDSDEKEGEESSAVFRERLRKELMKDDHGDAWSCGKCMLGM